MSPQRGRVRAETGSKRVRAYLRGELVADTVRPLLVWEKSYYPAYYLPAVDVTAELVATGDIRRSPSRGDGLVQHVEVAGTVAPDAALTFPESPIEELRDHVRLDWDSMTSWFEEDEQVFTHPRSPYTRIDILPTSRRVEIRVGDEVLADTTRAHLLFETGLQPRWYLPQVDIRMDRMVPSETVTQCPYKGTAEHFTAVLGDRTVEDAGWIYRTPLPESQRIAGLVAFYPDRVQVLVDGVQV